MITPFSNWCDLTDLGILDAKVYASGREDQNVVVNSEGDIIATVPKSWSEDDVKKALQIANDAYIRGFETGERNVKNQFKRVLGIHQ